MDAEHLLLSQCFTNPFPHFLLQPESFHRLEDFSNIRFLIYGPGSLNVENRAVLCPSLTIFIEAFRQGEAAERQFFDL